MDDQYLLPLLGVFVGWVLTTISAGFKERNQRKQLIGQLLTKLIRVERQAETLIQASENTKDFTDDWEKYEPIRQYILSTHFLEPESVRTDLKNAIDNCAPYFPNLAVDLEDCYEAFEKQNKFIVNERQKQGRIFTDAVHVRSCPRFLLERIRINGEQSCMEV